MESQKDTTVNRGLGEVFDEVEVTVENVNLDLSKLKKTEEIYIQPEDIDQDTLVDKSRRPHWNFTIHNYHDPKSGDIDISKARVKALLDNLVTSKKIQYYSVGFELGKKGTTPHLQGYIYTGKNNKKTFTAIKKCLSDISATPYLSYMYPRSSWLKCVAYTKKEHDFVEGGEAPHERDSEKRVTLDSLIEEVYHGTKISELIQRDPITRIISIKSTKTLERAYHAYQESLPYFPPFVAWFSGSTGTGKTSMANLLEEYLKEEVFEITCDNGFFEGYNSQPYVYFDDFRFNPTDLSFQKLLSLTCEKKNTRVNIKGSSVPWRPRIIIFTSPNGVIDAKPYESQHNESYNRRIKENFKQLQRRVHLSLKFNFPCEEGSYVGRERIEKTIREKGIPRFLRYYKYHCLKFDIPLNECLNDVTPLQYSIDRLKDNTPNEKDDIVEHDHHIDYDVSPSFSF